jgi:hypothetical protein
MSVALLVHAVTGNVAWVAPFGALGYADGLLGGIGRAIASAQKTAPLRAWLRSNPFKSAAIVIGIAMLCGDQVGVLGGVAQAAGCRIVNAFFGLILWALLLVAARRDQSRDVASPREYSESTRIADSL